MSSIYDRLPEPVILVREERITACNPAARARLAEPGGDIGALLTPEELACYRDYGGSGTLELCLILGDGVHSATVRREGEDDVFLVRPQPLHAAVEPDMMALAARTLRFQLTEPFAAASVLFPMLEELENPVIQAQTAVLGRGFHRLLRTAANLELAGRLAAGGVQPDLERVELSEFFLALLEKAQSLFAVRGVALRADVPVQPFYAAIDRQLMERAILNLLSNALQYAEKEVLLQVENAGDRVYLRVRDDGGGMAPSAMGAAFDSTAVSPEALLDPRRGLGLGLTLARSIAVLHGGAAVLHSEEGRGVTVTLSFSRQRKLPPEMVLRSPATAADYAGARDHVLLELSDALPASVFDTVNLG